MLFFARDDIIPCGDGMKLKITVNSVHCDTPYGGEQIIDCEQGEYMLDEIFRLPFFRIIIDDVIEGNVCFRLMEGGVPHYFVLSEEARSSRWERETPTGEDCFLFETAE